MGKYILGELNIWSEVVTWTSGSLSSWWKTVLRWEERSRDQPTTLPASPFLSVLLFIFSFWLCHFPSFLVIFFACAVSGDKSTPCLAPLKDNNSCVMDCRHLEGRNIKPVLEVLLEGQMAPRRKYYSALSRGTVLRFPNQRQARAC